MSGGSVDEKLEGQFKDITRTILENQNEALGNLTSKVCNPYNFTTWLMVRKIISFEVAHDRYMHFRSYLRMIFGRKQC